MNYFELDYVTVLSSLCADLDIPSHSRCIFLSRCKAEGFTFANVILPKLNDYLLQSLNRGSLLTQQEFTFFRFKRKAPHVLHGLIDEIFDIDTGLLLEKPCTIAIWRIRQISLYFYKLSLKFTESQVSAAESKFIDTDKQIGTALDIKFVDRMRKHIESSYSFPNSGHHVLSACRPRFGPGTFAGSVGKLPYWLAKTTDPILNGYRHRDNGISGFFKSIPSFKNILFKHQNDSSDCSEVLFVPKDSRGPRTIAREPIFALKAQMSFFDYFSRFFERETCGRINFSDQSTNRSLAELGSRDGSWATIDLKEASDRISFDLVKTLSRNIPAMNFFLRFRSSEAKLPSGERIRLKKLAGMGSGLTFVWLALVCHTAVATEISMRTGVSFKDAARDVYVYGDDIVIKSCHVSYALSALPKVGLSVNEGKSFWRQTRDKAPCFRESCGGDFFAGSDVGITRIKLSNCNVEIDRVVKRIRFENTPLALAALNAHGAELALNGHIKTSRIIYGMLAQACGKLPKTRNSIPIVSEVTREFVDYPVDSVGTYSKVTVTCLRPVIVADPRISQLQNYSAALKPKVGSVLLEIPRPATGQFEIAVPRVLSAVRRKVSSIMFI